MFAAVIVKYTSSFILSYEKTYFILYFLIVHIFLILFKCRSLFQKSNGFEAALSQSLKIRNFSPTMIHC